MSDTIQRRLRSLNNRARASGFSKLQFAHQTMVSSLALILLFPSVPTQNLIAQDQQAPAQAPVPTSVHGTNARTIRATGGAHRALSRFTSGANTGGIDVPRTGGRRRTGGVQAHADLKGEALAQAVDELAWDPSVKALTAFPSVLGNMDKNLSWTSSLGDAYYNQEQEVMNAVQVMRRRAQQAGHLNSTPQQSVTTEGSDIEIGSQSAPKLSTCSCI